MAGQNSGDINVAEHHTAANAYVADSNVADKVVTTNPDGNKGHVQYNASVATRNPYRKVAMPHGVSDSNAYTNVSNEMQGLAHTKEQSPAFIPPTGGVGMPGADERGLEEGRHPASKTTQHKGPDHSGGSHYTVACGRTP